MCDPVTATAVAAATLKVGSAVLDHKAQNQAAAANEASAVEALKVKDNELSIRELQERIAGNQQIDQGNQSVAQASGDVNAGAASRGVGGVTVDLLLHDVQRQGSAYTDSVNDNTRNEVDQLEREKAGALAEEKSRIAGVPKASLLATGLKIGGDVLDYASTRVNMSPKGVK